MSVEEYTMQAYNALRRGEDKDVVLYFIHKAYLAQKEREQKAKEEESINMMNEYML